MMDLTTTSGSAGARRGAGPGATGLLAALTRRRQDMLALAVAVLGIIALDARGAFVPVANAIVAAHKKAAPLVASGDIVFVAIDAYSVSAIGSWPWSRRVYSDLIRELIGAGATEVFLDIDLSMRTDPEADAELAQTLQRYGASVVLPAFMQRGSVGGEGAARTMPLPEFSKPAWLASVNVTADLDGIVRRSPFGAFIGDEEVPSAAAMLGGDLGPVGSEFLINFALDPATVPAVSAIDVLNGTSGLDFHRRSVVVGAHALEIRDTMTVPVHGAVAGSMVLILAAETLAQGRALRTVSRMPALVLAGILAWALLTLSRGSVRHSMFSLVGAALGVEVLAFWLQARYALVLPVPALVSVFFVSKVMAAERELNIRGRLVQFAHVETSNTERILEAVISDSSDAVVVADDRLRVLRLSESARALFDLADEVGPGSPLADVVPVEMATAARDALASLETVAPRPAERETLNLPSHGVQRCIEFIAKASGLEQVDGRGSESDEAAIVCLTARDVTAEWAHREEMDRLARYDTLTGAINRTEFVRQLNGRIGGSAEGCAVIAFNIHRLQTVNATLGRAAGDELLTAVVNWADGFDIGLAPLARMGGDRFATYTLGSVTSGEAHYAAERLTRRLNMPFRLGDQVVRIALHVGVAGGGAGDDAEFLLGKAELALDEARHRSGPGLRTFDGEGFARQERRRHIERAHWTALTEEQVFLTYQPQVRLSDGVPVGGEALVRWNHPTLGSVSPSEFIAIAEASGFIEHLGRWVMETACFDATEWPDDQMVSVNVSPAQFHRSDVVADVERALAVSGLPPQRLFLEITETLFFGGGDFSGTFAGLRRLGVSLALDDFGSGYSSYGHLAQLPLDKLKVDRMFVQGLDVAPFNRAVIRSVGSLCGELGLTLVCEGVETEAQAEALKVLGCDEAQGFLFGRPELQEDFLKRFSKARDPSGRASSAATSRGQG